ncbi:type II toxin-antitoxin system VapC family toxin [Candidatus Micrarchaeota archaeon]|nr:type II toxin-antitoxin system VapC family toxin [Candidatus Micrarchaeota archaeon]
MIVDSSFLISFYSKKDANHEEAVKQMKEHEDFLLIPDYVVGETATVLLYKNSLRNSNLFLEIMENTKNIKILYTSPSDFKGVFDVFKNQKKQLNFVDACIVYHARKLRLGVLTFDKNIQKEIKKI